MNLKRHLKYIFILCVSLNRPDSPDIYEDPSFVKLFIQCHLIYFCICLIFISHLSIWIKTMWQLLLVTAVGLVLAAWIRRQEITEPGNSPGDEKWKMLDVQCSVTLSQVSPWPYTLFALYPHIIMLYSPIWTPHHIKVFCNPGNIYVLNLSLSNELNSL